MKCLFKIHLRTLQFGLHVWAIVAALCTFLPLGYTWKYFKLNCVLYARVSARANGTGHVFVDQGESAWGRESVCEFTTYISVVAGIHAFIWLWFFLLMKGTLKSESHEYYMQLPACLLHSIMFLILFVSSSIISAGANSFCGHLTKALDNRFSCSQAARQPWDIFLTNAGVPFATHNFYAFLVLAKIASWLMTISLLGQTLLSGFKLYKWFLKDHPEYMRHKTRMEDEEKSNTADDTIDNIDAETVDSKDSIMLLSDDL